MLDILLVIALVLFASRGWKRGLVLSVFSIIGYIVSLIIARTFSPQITNFIISNTGLDTWIDNLLGNQIREAVQLNISTSMMTGVATKAVINMIFFFIIFIITSIIISRLARFINRIGKIPFIGGINRFGGLVFGTIKGFLLVFIILAFMTLIVNTGNYKLEAAISKTVLIDAMYENNPIVYFISDMFLSAKNTLSS